MSYLSRSVSGLVTIVLLTGVSACSSPDTPPANESGLSEIDAHETVALETVTPKTSQTEARVSVSPAPKWAKVLPLPEYPKDRTEQTRNGIEYLPRTE